MQNYTFLKFPQESIEFYDTTFEDDGYICLSKNLFRAYQRVKYIYCFKDIWSIPPWFKTVSPYMFEELKRRNKYKNYIWRNHDVFWRTSTLSLLKISHPTSCVAYASLSTSEGK
jgi:hypothetical protein